MRILLLIGSLECEVGQAKKASESHEGLGNQQVMRLLFEDGRVTGACGQG